MYLLIATYVPPRHFPSLHLKVGWGSLAIMVSWPTTDHNTIIWSWYAPQRCPVTVLSLSIWSYNRWLLYFTLKFVWIWSPFQSNGSFFMRRLSRGKYPGGYRRLWYWSHKMRLLLNQSYKFINIKPIIPRHSWNFHSLQTAHFPCKFYACVIYKE
jgi:hypothetical protein